MPEMKFKKRNEISSTERLLETIRSSGGDDSGDPDPPPPTGSLKKKAHMLFGGNNYYKKMTVHVGVIFSYDRLSLVVISPDGNKRWKIIDYLELLFEEGMTVDDLTFPDFLGNALKKFTGGYKKVLIWSCIPSVDVEIRYLKIPKVSKDKIADAVYWTFKKESKFDETLHIFDYELIDNIIDKGVEKIEVIAYTAPKRDIEKRKELFIAAGFPLIGITVVALAFQNYLCNIKKSGNRKNSCLLFIGRDWARIDLYTDGFLTLSRDIKTGYLSMVEAVTDAINREPEKYLPHDATSFREVLSVNEEEVEKLLIDLLYGEISYRDIQNKIGVNEASISEMVNPVTNRLAKQIDRTLEFFASNYNDYPVETIYVSGLISASKVFMKTFAKKVSHPVTFFDPFKTDGPIECETEPPELIAVKDQFSPALCMALSGDPEKFNFLNTRKDKAHKRYIKRVNYSVISVFIVAMLLCVGFYSWQRHDISIKQGYLATLTSKLDNYSPVVSKDIVSVLSGKVIQDEVRLKSYVKTYSAMALICEATRITPSNIYLSRFAIKSAGAGKDAGNKKTIQVVGIVIDEEISLESTLAKFILNLSGSPLIKDASVQEKSFDTLGGDKIVRFTALLETNNG